MAKSADAFRTISEVAEWLETPAHVLRFWESKFAQVKPVKRAGGRRYYRPQDMQLLGGIKKLLHDDGMTIKSVQKMLRQDGIRQVAALSKDLPAGMSAPAAKPAKPKKARPAPVAEVVPIPVEPDTSASDQDGAVTPEPLVEESSAVAAEAAEPVTEKAPAQEEEPSVSDEPELPMFASRERAAAEEPAPAEPESDKDTDADAAPAPDLHVDVPDDPEDALGLSGGVLGQILSLPRPLTPAQAAELRPFIDQLGAYLEKAG